MKIAVRKYSFIGPISEARKFLEDIQRTSSIEFIGNNKDSSNVFREKMNLIKSYYSDINERVKEESGIKSQNNESITKENVVDYVRNVLALKVDEFEVRKSIEQLEEDIETYKELGITSIVESKDDLNGVFKISFISSEKEIKEEVGTGVYSIYLNTFKNRKWYALFYHPEISDEELDKFLPKGKSYFHAKKSLPQLLEEESEAKKRLFEIEQEFREFTSCISDINREFVEIANSLKKEEVYSGFQFSEEAMIFFSEGWVKETDVSKVLNLCRKNHVSCEIAKVQEDEVIPTCIENKGYKKVGDMIVKMYDIPSSGDMDLSFFVLGFFMLFYGIIVGDMGYGIIQMAAILAIKKAVKSKSKITNNLFNVGIMFGASVLMWGAFTGNLFGYDLVNVPKIGKYVPISFIAKKKNDYLLNSKKAFKKKSVTYDINTLNNDENNPVSVKGFVDYDNYESVRNSVLFEMALLLGCFHILLGMLIDLKRKPTNIGWGIALIGSFFAVSKYMDAVSVFDYLINGKYVAFIYLHKYLMIKFGVALSVLISILQTGLTGIFEITNAVQLFSDVMSYLRLYALGLSGSILAVTFNTLGLSMGWFGIPVIIIGHTVNLILCIMGGAIHGTRLNFVEWFRYCFDGGGSIFKPLMKVRDISEE